MTSEEPPLCPVITATPTIQSGLVIRWFRGMGGYENRGAVLSASRDGVMIHGDVFLHDLPGEWVEAAKGATAAIRAEAQEDAKALATHRQDGFLGPLVSVDEVPA